MTSETDDTLEEVFEVAIRARLGTAVGLAIAAVVLVVAPALAWGHGWRACPGRWGTR